MANDRRGGGQPPKRPGGYGDRPSYGNRPQGDRPAYGNRPQGGRPGYGDRPQGDRPSYGNRPQGGRPGYGDRPQGGRPGYGDRPQGGRPGYGDRPQGDRPSYGNRPQGDRPAYGNRPQGDRPAYGNRPQGGRPGYGDRPQGDRPAYGNRPQGDRPAYGNRPQGDRPAYGNRPQGGRPGYGDRPQGDRPAYGNRPQGDRPAYGNRPQGGRPGYGDRPQGDRPAYGNRPQGDRPAYGNRPQGDRPAYGDRPQGDRPAYGNRPQGDRPAYGNRPQGGRPGYGDGPQGGKPAFRTGAAQRVSPPPRTARPANDVPRAQFAPSAPRREEFARPQRDDRARTREDALWEAFDVGEEDLVDSAPRRETPAPRANAGAPERKVGVGVRVGGARRAAPPPAEEQEQPENLLVGRNAIREALKAGSALEKLLVARGDLSGSAREIIAKAREAHVIVQEVDRERLDAVYKNHQGMLAYASAARYQTLEDMLSLAESRAEQPFLVILDGVTDPHNLGAILRSAECCGAHGVLLPERRAAGLTPAAVKAAAGATEYLPVAKVVNIPRLIEQLKEKGLWILAATPDGEPYDETDLSGPIALIVGGEGDGISHLALERSDKRVSIPLKGKIESLNASVAAGILLAAVMGARKP